MVIQEPDSVNTGDKRNTFFGYVLGVLVFTSFEDWRFTHIRHHGTYANLNSRGFGDIWTLTKKEYENSRDSDWDPLRASMKGSSFYKLPAVPRWFSCNIGYHHVHHLHPMIPNYHLRKCYGSVPELQEKAPLTLRKSLTCYRLKLWDEDLRKMVAFP